MINDETGQRAALPVANQEVPFDFAELFFSRTSRAGIIQSGNSVFQRVSLYPWEELIGKPHNVIRHPDMPRAVFWLLWNAIKQDKPIGAYVKNRAKDGRYYWVYAIITPVEDGYLSVRLKPSALLPLVEKEYKALAAAEAEGKLRPKESAALLLERLAELGYENYESFMTAALNQELIARAHEQSTEPDRSIKSFDRLVAQAKSLIAGAQTIFSAYEANKYVPINLSIQAAQLGAAGTTIGVISENYNIISTEIKENLNVFIASAQKVLQAIVAGQFQFCTAKVQQEVADFFRNEKSSAQSSADDTALLDFQREEYRQKAETALRDIVGQAARFEQDCSAMKHLAAGLEVTRVMGMMESARLPTAREGLDGLIGDLKSFQVSIASSLTKIDGINKDVQYDASSLLRTTAASGKTTPAPVREQPAMELRPAA